MPSGVQDVVTHVKFCQGWSKGFSVARGRILAFSIDLLSKPLEHSRTTVWVCDRKNSNRNNGKLNLLSQKRLGH